MRAEIRDAADWYQRDGRRQSRITRWLKHIALAAGFSAMLNVWFLHLLLNGRCF